MAEYDWKSIKEQAGVAELSVVPNDTYDCVVIRANAKQTGRGDKDCVYGIFEIVSGPYSGKAFMQQFTISPENPIALGIFVQHMAAMGVQLTNQEPADIAKEIVGARVRAKIQLDMQFNRMKIDAGGLTSATQAPPPVQAAPPVAAPPPVQATNAPAQVPAPAPAPVQEAAPAPAPAPEPVAEQPAAAPKPPF